MTRAIRTNGSASEDGDVEWYEAWFDRDEYNVVYGHRDSEEAAVLVALVESVVKPEPSATILDVGCGRGRHAVEFASRGYRVTGVDLSPRSIEAAAELSKEQGHEVGFHIGDMRDPFCSACFDVVTNLFTAFGYFSVESDHEKALAAMAEAVTPGGWFVQDFLNADHVRRNLVVEDYRTDGPYDITQRRNITDGRIEKTIRISGPGGDRVFSESVRLLTLDLLERMYRRSGLILSRVFGDYAGGPLTPDSPRLIMLARKTDLQPRTA